MNKIGILHPGQMGVTIAAAAVVAGNDVYWCGSGRSAATRQRATEAGLQDCDNLQQLCDQAEVIFSVCPPSQALSLAGKVTTSGFSGIYVDCNAVSPSTSIQTGSCVTAIGATYVDAGIIGPPARQAGSTRLYLSGKHSEAVIPLFSGSVLDVRVVSDKSGDASALKMAYAGWTKGSAALLMTMYATAKHYNIDQALLDEWSLSLPALAAKLESATTGNAPKAWRFVGEMHQIAETVAQSGLDEEWFVAAGKTYARLESMKNSQSPGSAAVIESLLHPDED